MKKVILSLFFLIFISRQSFAQRTWVDSMEVYAQTVLMPPHKYTWTWQSAALLKTMIVRYEQSSMSEQKKYLDYVKKSIGNVRIMVNGRNPNNVASGVGLAFLARVTGEQKYIDAANKVFKQYLNIPRAENGGVTHLANYKELWDDTVYMIGVFLQEMYRLTGDEKYISELVGQIDAHREKLHNKEWGLWYHGWDGDNKNHCNFCGQNGWSDNPDKRSQEFWGRGNGWVIVTLSETLQLLPAEHPHREKLASYLKEMLVRLPELQDSATGHWFQLPVRKNEAGNFIESSCTAMFAFGILSALDMGILSGNEYQQSVDRAFYGLRNYSVKELKGSYLTTKNVCKGTCIGDKDYYFNRSAKSEKKYGLGMFILFGSSYVLNSNSFDSSNRTK
jgi:unsaturated rhamnogalacturonyl hydrolase